MTAELELALGIAGSLASIISLKPLIEAELAARRTAGSIVDSAITPPHRQIVRTIVMKLSSGCWRYSELKSAYKRSCDNAERIQSDFWNGFDNDSAVNLVCELCKEYVVCEFDFEIMVKKMLKSYEGVKVFFNCEDGAVFDNNMKQLIPIFTYFLTDDSRIAQQWIASDLRAINEKIERRDLSKERYFIDKDLEIEFVESFLQGKPLKKIIGKSSSKILALYQIVLAVRDKQVREVICRAGGNTDRGGGENSNVWKILQNFIVGNISLETIRKDLFDAFRLLENEKKYTNNSFKVDGIFQDNVILLILTIAFLKCDKFTIRPIVGSDDSGMFYNYKFNYHCEGYQDLEVLVSFAVNKDIDLHRIESRYCELGFVETGISGNVENGINGKENKSNRISKNAIVIWNAVSLNSQLDSKSERKARALNKIGGEMLNHVYRDCIVIVFGPEVSERCVYEMCKCIPNVVFVQKDESENASELFEADFAEEFELCIDAFLNNGLQTS